MATSLNSVISRYLGSLFYDTDPKKVDKISLRVVHVVHLGYSLTQKGYILYDLSSKSFFVSRKIKEEVFPSKDIKSSPDQLFPVVSFPNELSLVDFSCSIDTAVYFVPKEYPSCTVV